MLNFKQQISIFISLLVFSGIAFSQNEVTNILYELKFHKYNGTDKYFADYYQLSLNSKQSVFASEKFFKMDSIQKTRGLTDIERVSANLFNPYVIKFNERELNFKEVIGNVLFEYSETLDYKWTISKEVKVIDGLSCTKATTNYGGRNWIAWFTKDIPIQAGPYKFRNLPGLIVEIKDSNEDYQFNLVSLSAPNKNFEQLDAKLGLKRETVIVQHTEFNTIKRNYNAMTFDERLNFMNKDKSLRYKGISTNPDTGEVNPQLKPPSLVFIETTD